MKMIKNSVEYDKWKTVKDHIEGEKVSFGSYISYHLKHTPRRVLFTLSCYKFAAKMFGEGREILEVGCAEGFGTILLAEFAKKVVAVDIDKESIHKAEENFASDKIEFREMDFLGKKIGKFDGVASFDVIEHIFPENEDKFFSSICLNMKKDGVCIIGTPSKNSQKYASKVAKMGHVNIYTSERLKKAMLSYFRHVFIFSVNDELVHTGFYPMAHSLIGIGVGIK